MEDGYFSLLPSSDVDGGDRGLVRQNRFPSNSNPLLTLATPHPPNPGIDDLGWCQRMDAASVCPPGPGQGGWGRQWRKGR